MAKNQNSDNQLPTSWSTTEAGSLIDLTFLRLSKAVVRASDRTTLVTILNEVCARLDAGHIILLCRESRNSDYRLILQSIADENASQALPNRISSGSAFWRSLNNLPIRELSRISAKFRIGPDYYGLAKSLSKDKRTVILVQSATTSRPTAELKLFRWMCGSLYGSWLKNRTYQSITIENNALHSLMKHTDEAFARWDKKSGWSFFNQALPYRLGHDPKNQALKNVFGNEALVHESDWRRICQQLEECKKAGHDQKIEYTIKSPDGNWHNILTTLCRDIAEDHDFINAVSIDITQSKQLESKAIAQSELETWLLEQNRILYNQCDKAAVDTIMAALGERFNLLRSYIFIYQDQDAPVFSQWCKPGVKPSSEILLVWDPEAHKIKQPLTFDDPGGYEDNSFISLPQFGLDTKAIVLIPIGSEAETIGYLACESSETRQWGELEHRATRMIADTLTMVLAKENILQKLESSRQQFQKAMDAAAYGLWELKTPSLLMKLSPAYYDMLGLKRPAETGFASADISSVHIDDKQFIVEQAKKLAAGLIHELDYEIRHLGVDGNIKWVLTRGRIIKWDDTGKPILAMGTTSDITELKLTQTDLQLAYQQAESARLAKGEFLARMSHEIRTPMNAIIGLAYILLRSKLDDQQLSQVQDIDRAAKSLLQIIDDILDFSKIEAGKLLIENHNFNFRKLIERLRHQYAYIVAEKDLNFNVNIGPSVPHILRADSTRVRQVLANLLNNAFKFTSQGGVSLNIDCEQRTNKDRILLFEVKDSGIGLSEDQMATLFDPFTQADGSRTRQYGGTGLGLSISQQLIKMMGGDINVESEAGKGSTFAFSVSCQAASRKDRQLGTLAPSTSTEGDYATLKHRGLKVLMVEDNKVNQKVAIGMLRDLGVTTTLANNGIEALHMMKACDNGEFDLILMDIEMPYMGGFETTLAIRQIARHRKVPVIAMTAHIVDGEKERYLQAGMNDCISKPIAPALLAQTLRDNLSPKSGRSA